jgi:hypothetical protein
MKRIFAAAIVVALTQPSFADDIKRVSGADLSVQTHKWDGKTIETSGYCFYSDVGDYRCLAGDPAASARIDFKQIEPDSAREAVESHCDTLEKLISRSCRFRFRFIYDGFGELPGGGGDIIHVVIPKDGLGTILTK